LAQECLNHLERHNWFDGVIIKAVDLWLQDHMFNSRPFCCQLASSIRTERQ